MRSRYFFIEKHGAFGKLTFTKEHFINQFNARQKTFIEKLEHDKNLFRRYWRKEIKKKKKKFNRCN